MNFSQGGVGGLGGGGRGGFFKKYPTTQPPPHLHNISDWSGRPYDRQIFFLKD